MVVALAGVIGLFATEAHAWRQDTPIVDPNTGLAIDANGDVVAVSTAFGPTFLVVKYSGATGAELWRYTLYSAAAETVVFYPDGDVAAAGMRQFGSEQEAYVVRLNGADGTKRWDAILPGVTSGGYYGHFVSVAVDSLGNIAAAGWVDGGDTLLDFAVGKFAAADGQLLWQASFDGGPYAADQGFSVAFDAADDVVAGGVLSPATLLTVKLAAADGSELWRSESTGILLMQVAVAPGGDVVAAGAGLGEFDQPACRVFRLAGATGDTLWSATVDPELQGYAMTVAAAPNGDVIAAGQTGEELLAIRLEGASGDELWRYQLTGQSPSRVEEVRLGPSGDVALAGWVPQGSRSDYFVAKLDGVTGDEQWQYVLNGGTNFTDFASSVGVDANDDVVAAGATINGSCCGQDLTVVKRNGSDGSDFPSTTTTTSTSSSTSSTSSSSSTTSSPSTTTSSTSTSTSTSTSSTSTSSTSSSSSSTSSTSTSSTSSTSLPPCVPGATIFRNPTQQAADTGGDHDGFEVTPTNAFVDDTSPARNSNGSGDRHRFYGYGLTVPAGCAVKGIEVKLDWKLNNVTGTSSMGVELSSDGGSTWTASKTDPVETGTFHQATLGGPADLWGRAWTPADVGNGFRVRVQCNSTAVGKDFFLDWVAVRVTYGP
jgi:hypothetical protein